MTIGVNRAGRGQILRLEVRGAELHLARARIAGGRNWRLEQSMEGSDRRRIRRRENRGHNCARFNRRHGALVGSDASGRTRRARPKNCTRVAANDAAFISRCAGGTSSDGRDADEYGCEHARARECGDAPRFARDARPRVAQFASGNRYQCDVHISRDQHRIRSTHSDDCDRDFGGGRIDSPHRNCGHGITRDLMRSNYGNHLSENFGEVTVVRSPSSRGRRRRLGKNGGDNNINSEGASDNRSNNAVAAAGDRGYIMYPTLLGRVATIALLIFFAFVFVRIVWPPVFGNPITDRANAFVRSVNALSLLAIPFLLSFFPIYAAARRVKVYEEFVEGAKEGFNVILRIIPFLVTILVAIGMFKGAGGIDLLTEWLTPVLAPLHFPSDLLPLALMRPLSGSGTLALLTEIVHRLGPDNIVSLTAATIYGSTETTFYVAAVYFGSVGVKQTRHAIPARLLADLVGVIASVAICRAAL
jgi:spore maturation protein B